MNQGPRLASYTDARGIVSHGCGCALYTLAEGVVVAQACQQHRGRMVVELRARPDIAPVSVQDGRG